jgi:creatinine amidohydrolase/Fe(II)-dependent formamide hydrolase-like protein
VQLQLKTWTFVEDYLKTKTGIIIPIGSTEQHGPTGLIGTDALTAEMIGRGAGEKAGALGAPTISSACSSSTWRSPVRLRCGPRPSSPSCATP